MLSFHEFILNLGLPVQISAEECQKALHRIQCANMKGGNTVVGYTRIYDERNLGLISSSLALLEDDVVAIVDLLRGVDQEVVSFGCGIGLIELYLAYVTKAPMLCWDICPKAIRLSNELKARAAVENIQFCIRDYTKNIDPGSIKYALCLRGFPRDPDEYRVAVQSIDKQLAHEATIVISDNYHHDRGNRIFSLLGYPYSQLGPDISKGVKPWSSAEAHASVVTAFLVA